MARPSSDLARELTSHLRGLEGTRQRVERLASTGHMGRYDVERVYESLFLNCLALYEVFVEDLFIGLMVEKQGLTSTRRDVKPRPRILSHTVAREIVTGDRSYVDWLPYTRTEERAKVYFVGGRPFSVLDQRHKGPMQSCVWIRNAIAHKSRYARRVFEDKVLHDLVLAPRERTPAGFLRSTIYGLPRQTRYEYYIAQLMSAARALSV